MNTQSAAGRVAIYGFALVFCAVGGGLLWGAHTTFQEGGKTNALMMLIAGLAFGGAGLAVFVQVRVGYRLIAREAALQAAHPDEPWMWRDDWATGRVHGPGRSVVWAFWAFAVLWNLLASPLLFFLPEEILEKENYGALLGLLFPLVGVGLVAFAAYKTTQRRKFGDCEFLMERVPGVLGGELSGTFQVARGLPSGEALTVQLSCIHRQRWRSGKGTSTQERVLWQTEPVKAPLFSAGGGTSQTSAVMIRLPYDASPTAVMDQNNSIIWRLEASAAVAGIDFAASFEIPVFRTADSSPLLTEEQLRSESVSAAEFAPGYGVGGAVGEGVKVVSNAGGGTEFVLKPQGSLRDALPSLAIIFLFAGISVLLGYTGAPFFSLVFGAVALVLVFLVIFGIMGESRIVVEEGHLSVRNSLFGFVTGRRIPCSSIAKISVKGESRAGKAGHFSVVLTQTDGRSASPLQFMRERRQADWLAEEVRKAIEPSRQMSSSYVSPSQA